MSGSDEVDQSRRPSKSDFKQQTLPAWQPILTPRTVYVAFFLVGIIFTPLGAFLFVESQSVLEYSADYTPCKPANSSGTLASQLCTIDIEIPEKMTAPVYVYYQLTNYYQNHRRYVKSRNDDQLRGEPPTSWGDLEDCLPRIAVNGDADKENPANWYIPCGLIAWTMFNDTFTLDRSGIPVTMIKDGIAWESDRTVKFKNPPDWSTVVGTRDPLIDFSDEDFIVWMRTAGLPHFRKLHRIINEDMEAGVYRLNVTSNFPVEEFGGTKSFVVSTTSWVGGKNDFLGIAYIVVGSLCALLGVIFLIVDTIKPRRLGDQSFLVVTR